MCPTVWKQPWLGRGKAVREGAGEAGRGPIPSLVSHDKGPGLSEQWETYREFKARHILRLIVCCGGCVEDELEGACEDIYKLQGAHVSISYNP